MSGLMPGLNPGLQPAPAAADTGQPVRPWREVLLGVPLGLGLFVGA